MNQRRVCAVLLAAGSGSRMNLDVTKQRLCVKGKSVVVRVLEAFEGCADVTDIVLVVRKEEVEFAINETEGRFSKLRKIVTGGKSRIESAKMGFFAIDFPCEYVAVHDAARCLIKPYMITKVVNDAFIYQAASASSVVVDTVKRIDSKGFCLRTERREELRLASTPQIFKYELYMKAISQVDTCDPDITDDNMLMEKIGIPVYMTDIGYGNIKITYSDDIALAEYLLEKAND